MGIRRSGVHIDWIIYKYFQWHPSNVLECTNNIRYSDAVFYHFLDI